MHPGRNRALLLVDSADITVLLHRWSAGDQSARDQLFQMVYPQLRRIAGRRAAGQQVGATTLVHETYLKMFGGDGAEYRDRNHFFAVAATAMRQIVLDQLRYFATAKRKGAQADVSLDGMAASMDWTPERVTAFEQGIAALSAHDMDALRVFECKFFAGYGTQETADALELSVRAVERHWTESRRFLAGYVDPQ